MDVCIENHGSLFVFVLSSEAARKWVAENVSDPQYFGHWRLVVEHRYAPDLTVGMMDAGLEIE
jgi:hypothetical protein